MTRWPSGQWQRAVNSSRSNSHVGSNPTLVFMTIKELIKHLQEFNQDLPVFIAVLNNDGCGTCGHGATTSEETPVIRDMESKIHISAS